MDEWKFSCSQKSNSFQVIYSREKSFFFDRDIYCIISIIILEKRLRGAEPRELPSCLVLHCLGTYLSYGVLTPYTHTLMSSLSSNTTVSPSPMISDDGANRILLFPLVLVGIIPSHPTPPNVTFREVFIRYSFQSLLHEFALILISYSER